MISPGGAKLSAQYGESLAGVRPKDRNHQFDFPVSAYDGNKKLLPEIQTEPRGEIGAGDRKVQAYNFRLILTDDPDNRIPFAKPPATTRGGLSCWRASSPNSSKRKAAPRA